jgi:hypothetical protein
MSSKTSSGANQASIATRQQPRRRRATSPKVKPDGDKSSGATEGSNTTKATPRHGPEVATSPGHHVGVSDDPTMATCLKLAELRKVRQFCITQQMQIDRSLESAIASCLGFDVGAEAAERKKVYARAAAIIKAVAAGKPHNEQFPAGDPRAESLGYFLPMIPISQQSRLIWDEKREITEKEMRRLAQTLPVFPWVKEHARGVGDLGLARIVGAAPIIGLYGTHERLWKRLGLAVIAGERQQKRKDKDEAMLHGYAAPRRAEVWSVCSDIMLRQQWRGADDEVEGSVGFPIGAYGLVYQQRKAHTAQRITNTDNLPFTSRDKWTQKRCDNDARRIMSKEFLRDLWLVWHGEEPRWPGRFIEQQNAA